MAERNACLMGFFSYKTLLFLFLGTTTLFMLSWLFLLRSTGRSFLLDHNLLPNSKFLTSFRNDNFKPWEQREEMLQSTLVVQNEVATPQKKKSMGSGAVNRVLLKVYMYDLPPEFHFELLDWKSVGKSVWPDIRTKIPAYPGGLNLQHSIEYWLTLDLLSSAFLGDLSGRSAVRVHNSSEADVVFVPFFSSLSYNKYAKVKRERRKNGNHLLQEKLVGFLKNQEEWKRSGGRDHLILAHHPNSLLKARMNLWPAMFVLSDFGRYPPRIANLEKDIIAPYRHLIRSFFNDSSGFDSRPTLLYFQGAIYRKDGGIVRQELFYLLKDEKDVHFSFGTVLKGGISKASEGMHSSKFCLNIAGDTPSSNRLFDAIASHCVPVIISDEIELPYEDVLDYSEFCVFIRTSDALKEKFVVNLIRNITREEWTRMWERLKEVDTFFEYQYPSKEGDAVSMIWQAVARKLPSVRMKVHKSRRFARFGSVSERKLKSFPVPISLG